MSLRALYLFVREVAPLLWELLVEGKKCDEIRLSDVRAELALRRLESLAAEERARRALLTRKG